MITNRFMHIHLPRAAGNTFRAVVRRLRKYDLIILDDSSHVSYSWLTARCREMGWREVPAVTFVRDPWRWYPSQWRWLRHTRHADFCGSFEDYIEILQRHCFSDWNWFPLSGCYHLLGAENADFTGRVMTFGEDVLEVFGRYAPDIPRQAVQATLDEVGVTNASPPDLLSEWTPAIASLVASWDRDIIERFGYEKWPASLSP